MPLVPGEMFDRYRIEARLGGGGMGEVFRAYDTRLERYVALKVLREEASLGLSDRGSDGSAKMLREARAAATLTHPNVAAVFDVGEHEARAYIAMELVEGGSLAERVGDPAVPIATRVTWLLQVARALDAAHARGLVHRDVKPDNVMVTGDGVAKVVDFGVARVARAVSATASTLDAGSASSTLGGQGLIVGTPLYMAPEQVRGETVDARTDQFAWGVLAYALLAGKLPWSQAGGAVGLIGEILSREPDPLRAHEPRVPAGVEAAVTRALSKSARDRFSSMGVLVSAIESPPARAPRRRGRALFAAAAASLALLAAAGAMHRRGEVAPASASASASASSSSVAPVVDLAPPSSSDAARAAFRRGLQLARDGAGAQAIASFTRAATLDPSMSAAYLWAAFQRELATDPAGWNADLARARASKTALVGRDAALFAVLDEAPAEGDARAASALDAALARYPAEPWFHLLRSNERAETDLPGAIAALDRALELDPAFGQAWSLKAMHLLTQGRVAEAKRAVGQCLVASNAAVGCHFRRVIIDALEGECTALGDHALTIRTLEPENAVGYRAHVQSLVARGAPAPAVDAALLQLWDVTPEATRARTRLAGLARVAVLRGDFGAAAAHVDALAQLEEAATTRSAHASIARLRVELASEVGNRGEAARLAGEYLSAREAWLDDVGGWTDPGPLFFAALLRAGRITRSERRARVDALTAGWPRNLQAFEWLEAYGRTAVDEADAREALARLVELEPLPPWRWEAATMFAEGNVYALAGRANEALPTLERATRSCLAFDEPFEHTRAHLQLGHAYEILGRREDACAAYGVVLARWGAAGSVTADQARVHARGLGCAVGR